MTSIASSNGVKTVALIGTAAVAVAAALYLHQNQGLRRQRRRDDDDDETDGKEPTNRRRNHDDGGDDRRPEFYRELGIQEDELPPHVRREIEKERRWETKKELISMKSPMYDNVYMLGPGDDGGVMCTISLKKARWYVKKGIANWATPEENAKAAVTTTASSYEEPPKCIRLLFEPKGGNRHEVDTSPENVYLRTAKKNACVSCGSDDLHMRHYIVPYSYRTLLPDEYKTHMSHDIVIMCPDCHVRCERDMNKRMKIVEAEARQREFPGGETDATFSPMVEDTGLRYVRSCAIALVKWRGGLPSEKICEYDRTVREYLETNNKKYREQKEAANANADENANEEALPEPLTKAQLQKACGVNYRVRNPTYVSGCELVVRHLIAGGSSEIEGFVRDWRRFFLDVVEPRYMPAGWSVDNPVVCGRTAPPSTGDDDDVRRW